MVSAGPSSGDPILLVSTHTLDSFPANAPGGEREVPGGPALYIGRALDRLGRPWRLVTGDRSYAQVVYGPEGESYVMSPIRPIPLPERLVGPAVILSPVVGEIDPQSVPPVDGLLVVDLQGFVREPSRPTNRPGKRYDVRALVERAGVVKAAEEELALLTDETRRALNGTILLVTLGRQGARIHRAGAESFVPAVPVDAADTVGAGDTYLAAFVAHLLNRDSPTEAATRATRFTEEELRSRGPT